MDSFHNKTNSLLAIKSLQNVALYFQISSFSSLTALYASATLSLFPAYILFIV